MLLISFYYYYLFEEDLKKSLDAFANSHIFYSDMEENQIMFL